jgi:putative PIN family toxin of toxin-antitoxin system
MRVFLDTNVLVSAFAARGLCADLLELILLEHDLVVGNHVMLELSKALRVKLKLGATQVAEITQFVAGEAVQVANDAVPVDVAVDPADARVLGEALAAHAEFFVTGDAVLLEVAAVATLPITSPRRFWELLQAQKR